MTLLAAVQGCEAAAKLTGTGLPPRGCKWTAAQSPPARLSRRVQSREAALGSS